MPSKAKPPPTRAKALRCAIYTRVSTDGGLEQDFNSLDNQREASEAYIKSQAHEGWTLIRARYNDGGYSGGTMERPALQRLIDDVRAKMLDIVVVYKVDRLTRSLADFAKLVDLFDAAGVSFISVTQSFNTTTSMGRLTLNMLLSFAQFEREITGERIRDKVAASKTKGIWMGGAVPVGYRVENRALHVVETEAEFVRMLFRCYLELGSVVRLKSTLGAEEIVAPIRASGSGRRVGGRPLSRGNLYWILSNPIYIGRLRHKGLVHDGLHAALIEPGLWLQVQAKLASQTQPRRDATKDELSFLVGKLYDDRGNRMGASFAAKGTRRWRYYVSRAVLDGRTREAGAITRVSAPKIETLVTEAVVTYLASRSDLSARGCSTSGRSGAEIAGAIENVTLGIRSIEIVLANTTDGADDVEANETERKIVLPWRPGSAQRKREILQPADPTDPTPKRAMQTRAREIFIDALAAAHRLLDELVRDPAASVADIAKREHKSERSIRMTLTLALLAPDLAKPAMDGKLPRGFNRTRLVDLPMLWSEQWRTVGLLPPTPGGAVRA
jgi:DNA invertase Pin-like site-specific DNA recombinase